MNSGRIILLTIALMQGLNAQCTLPTVFQNSTWIDSDKGELTFDTQNMTGWELDYFQNPGDPLDLWECIHTETEDSKLYLIFQLSQILTIREDQFNVFMCMELTQVTDESFYYYLLWSDTPPTFDYDRIAGQYLNVTITDPRSQVCLNISDPVHAAVYPNIEEYHVLIKQDSIAAAGQECPAGYFGVYIYTITDMDSNMVSCGNTTHRLDVCSDYNIMAVGNDTCDTRFAYTENGSLSCVVSFVTEDYIYHTIYNNDDSVDGVATSRFTCFVSRLASNGSLQVSFTMGSCKKGQTAEDQPVHPNGSIAGFNAQLTPIKLCPKTADDDSNVSIGLIVGICIGTMVVIIVIIVAVCFVVKKRPSSSVGSDNHAMTKSSPTKNKAMSKPSPTKLKADNFNESIMNKRTAEWIVGIPPYETKFPEENKVNLQNETSTTFSVPTHLSLHEDIENETDHVTKPSIEHRAHAVTPTKSSDGFPVIANDNDSSQFESSKEDNVRKRNSDDPVLPAMMQTLQQSAPQNKSTQSTGASPILSKTPGQIGYHASLRPSTSQKVTNDNSTQTTDDLDKQPSVEEKRVGDENNITEFSLYLKDAKRQSEQKFHHKRPTAWAPTLSPVPNETSLSEDEDYPKNDVPPGIISNTIQSNQRTDNVNKDEQPPVHHNHVSAAILKHVPNNSVDNHPIAKTKPFCNKKRAKSNRKLLPVGGRRKATSNKIGQDAIGSLRETKIGTQKQENKKGTFYNDSIESDRHEPHSDLNETVFSDNGIYYDEDNEMERAMKTNDDAGSPVMKFKYGVVQTPSDELNDNDFVSPSALSISNRSINSVDKVGAQYFIDNESNSIVISVRSIDFDERNDRIDTDRDTLCFDENDDDVYEDEMTGDSSDAVKETNSNSLDKVNTAMEVLYQNIGDDPDKMILRDYEPEMFTIKE